jgi:hypothetical protein
MGMTRKILLSGKKSVTWIHPLLILKYTCQMKRFKSLLNHNEKLHLSLWKYPSTNC